MIRYKQKEAIDTINDLIWHNPFDSNSYIGGNCSRWTQDGKEITLETWLNKTDLQTLRSHITPGAVRELYQILGDPVYYDNTWESNNTLRLLPNEFALDVMRSPILIMVKSIQDSPIQGPSGYLSVKISGYISGTGLI